MRGSKADTGGHGRKWHTVEGTGLERDIPPAQAISLAFGHGRRVPEAFEHPKHGRDELTVHADCKVACLAAAQSSLILLHVTCKCTRLCRTMRRVARQPVCGAIARFMTHVKCKCLLIDQETRLTRRTGQSRLESSFKFGGLWLLSRSSAAIKEGGKKGIELAGCGQ